jgi:hypothetical protein
LNVTVCEWLASFDDSFATRWLFAMALKSAPVNATVCGWLDVPWMFTVIPPDAPSCAEAITAE